MILLVTDCPPHAPMLPAGHPLLARTGNRALQGKPYLQRQLQPEKSRRQQGMVTSPLSLLPTIATVSPLGHVLENIAQLR
jgi:hypothetical protein